MNAVWLHLPILQVVIPLFGALLAGLLRRAGPAFAVALVVSWLMPLIAGAMLWQVLATGPISLATWARSSSRMDGCGWMPPFNVTNATRACPFKSSGRPTTAASATRAGASATSR